MTGVPRMKLKARLRRIAQQRRELDDIEFMRQDVTEYGYLEPQVLQPLIASGRNPFPATSSAAYHDRLLTEGMQDRTEEVRELTSGLPDHLGSTTLTPHPVRIALIADRFFAASLEGTAHISHLTPDNWREVMEETDLLLVTSAWRGMDKEWFGLPRGWKVRDLLVQEIGPAYRRRNKPVVFFSKEDPPHHERFLPLAQAADHVFTTAEHKLDDYREACPQAQSFGVMSFGVNPQHHNPVGSRRRRLPEVMFAGSWRRDAYPERRVVGLEILNGVIQAGRDLIIHDRHFSEAKAKWAFPQRFIPHVAPALDHSLLLKLQRITDTQINLNSVIDSRTMYANRVVELQAMGAFVISNPNPGVMERFPAVSVVETAEETSALLTSPTGVERYRQQMRGLRTVYAAHTAHAHLGGMLAAVGLPTIETRPRVAVVGDRFVAERFVRSQQWEGPAPRIDAAEAGPALAETADVVLPVSADMDYGPGYAQDLINGFAYTASDFVAKATGADEHERVEEAPPEVSAIWSRSEAFSRWCATGHLSGTGYAADPFEVARRR